MLAGNNCPAEVAVLRKVLGALRDNDEYREGALQDNEHPEQSLVTRQHIGIRQGSIG